MPHEHAPPSVMIKNGGTVRNADAICEQPDGHRLLALANIFPIRNHRDEVKILRPNSWLIIATWGASLSSRCVKVLPDSRGVPAARKYSEDIVYWYVVAAIFDGLQ